MSGKFIKDTPTEIVISSGNSASITWRIVAVAMIILGIWLSQPMYEDGGFVAFIFILFLLTALFAWFLSENRIIIEFNRYPGFITITFQRFPLLFGLFLLARTKHVPLSEIHRASVDELYGFVRAGPDAVAGVSNYKFSLPAGDGTTLNVWLDHDREVIHHLARRVAEAAEKYINVSKPGENKPSQIPLG
ncbi:MAG: hypothetical protein A2Y58_04700 [Chloroflexi bacterium RBG_13_51_52]|nr:MAG: hypothetical protein A2Y58_04700 [Chloroflexi bacterium RBG_13_51_52]